MTDVVEEKWLPPGPRVFVDRLPDCLTCLWSLLLVGTWPKKSESHSAA